MKYTIEVPEVHIATHEVVADSTDEALEKIKMGESIELAFEYSHALEVKNICVQTYALSTVCTHLGCTPNWLEIDEEK
tara:strand:- start:792 stop:1025 length:234 start_codon:yes stop_codon:yes gene_type:complete